MESKAQELEATPEIEPSARRTLLQATARQLHSSIQYPPDMGQFLAVMGRVMTAQAVAGAEVRKGPRSGILAGKTRAERMGTIADCLPSIPGVEQPLPTCLSQNPGQTPSTLDSAIARHLKSLGTEGYPRSMLVHFQGE
jgi:hypothetical protein